MDQQGVFLQHNPYGNKINVNHPKMNDLYRRYKAWRGQPPQYPLTQAQRQEFEAYVMKSMKH